MPLQQFPRGLPGSQDGGFPDAAWCAPDKLTGSDKWQLTDGSILVGKLGDSPLAIRDDRHLLTVAGSRSGKGRSVIIPNMCLYPGSVVAIDPKGDLATITAARRGKGSNTSEGMNTRVYVLDPFETASGATKDYRASFNPLDAIEPGSLNGRDDAALLADSLIIPSQTESHWTDAAKMLLTGMILHVCASEPKERRHLLTLRSYLTADEDGFAELLADMSLSESCEGHCRPRSQCTTGDVG